MTGWLSANLDYLTLAVLVAALFGGLSLWLRRRGCRAGFPLATPVLLAAVLVGGWFLTDRAGRAASAGTRQKIAALLPVYAREFERLGHARLPTDCPTDDPTYLQLIQTQLSWQKFNPFIADIYTFRELPTGGLAVVVDCETDYNHNGVYDGPLEQRVIPGQLKIGHSPARDRALAGQAGFDEQVYTDLHGTWVSGYTPLHDADGKVEAVLGVDLEAAQWLADIRQARLPPISFAGVLALVILGGSTVIVLLRHELAERGRREGQLREQNELRRMIFDQAPGGIMLTDMSYRLVEVNEAFCRLLGYTRAELLRLTFVQLTHPDDVQPCLTVEDRLVAGQPGPARLETRYIRKDGSVAHVTLDVSLARDERGTPKYFVGQMADITERRRAEAELQNRQKQLSTILTHVPIILYAVDAKGIITLAEGAVTAAGRQPGEAVGQSVFDRYAARPDILEDVRRALSGQTVTNQHTVAGATFEARTLPVREADGRVSGLIGVAINITERATAARERERMERKLQEVQKLESLGVLAGGIAHDFNNLLTSILGNASLVRLALPDTSPVLGNIGQIEQASQTAANLCQQLLAYAGRGRLDMAPLNLSQLVRETTDLLRVSVGNQARLQFNLAPALPDIVADTVQLRQILLNLVLNAAEAIGHREGVIEVTTRRRTIDAGWIAGAHAGQDLPPGEYLALEVADNGPGFDAETRARVFDPFFTTKGTGRGLGLAAALGIMRSHHGALHLASQPGQGSRFTLLFPPPGQPAGATEAPPPAVARQWRGSGSVLVVDDEETVRATAAQMIAYFGFEVKQAGSGAQALEIVRQAEKAFDLVLLDLTMPGMDGYATFNALRELRPAQRIVVFSGYSAQDARARFAGKNLNGFLQKPFSTDALRAVLGQINPA